MEIPAAIYFESENDIAAYGNVYDTEISSDRRRGPENIFRCSSADNLMSAE